MPDHPVSEIRFADANGSSIAYMVYGDGPVTICAVPPAAQNIELAWGSPVLRRLFDRYARFSRQVVFDKRGTGMSDRRLDIPELDERVDELKAVMDDAGVERAWIHGLSEGGPMAIMFAATYPERVEGLILEGTAASLSTDERREMLRDPAALAAARERWLAYVERWGTPDSMSVAMYAPSLLDDAEFVAWWPRYERHAASRGALMALFEMNGRMDARGVLHRVDCPILILHRRDESIVPVEQARETRELFEEVGADVTLVELEGADHYPFAGDFEANVAAIERFTTGTVTSRPAPREHRVELVTLGRFEVRVDGEVVPTSAWGSRRARTCSSG